MGIRSRPENLYSDVLSQTLPKKKKIYMESLKKKKKKGIILYPN